MRRSSSLVSTRAINSLALGLPENAGARLAAARRDLAAALTIQPDFGPAQRVSGLLDYDQARFDEAIPAFERALAAVPLDREARQYLALSLLARDRAAPALEHALQLWETGPEHDDGPALVALARIVLGDRDGARAAIEAYDRLAQQRESHGQPRRFPDQPAFADLRHE